MKKVLFLFAFILSFTSFTSFSQGNNVNLVKVNAAPVSKSIKVSMGKFDKPSLKFNAFGTEFSVATQKQERIGDSGSVEAFYVFKTKEALIGSMVETDIALSYNGKPMKGFVYRTAKPSKKTGKYSYYIITASPNNPSHFGKKKIYIEREEDTDYTRKALNAEAQDYVDNIMIPRFKKKSEECLTNRTKEFWLKCIEDLENKPQNFSSTIVNRYKYSQDFTLQIRFALDEGAKLKSLQLKKWRAVEE